MIWLIGGTSESVVAAKLILELNLPLIISVTTEKARQLYPSNSNNSQYQIFVGKLSALDLPFFLNQYSIDRVIDCSHPFAVEISNLAIETCLHFEIPYIRYERPLITYQSPLITYVDSWESLVGVDSPLINKKVLLTIGAKNLPLFSNFHEQATLFCRLLPYPRSLEIAYESGFSCDRIIAIRPPLNMEMEKALWQLWDIEVVVTKAGGKGGGEDIKYQTAQELNIPVIVMTRPHINYPQVIQDFNLIKQYLINYYN